VEALEPSETFAVYRSDFDHVRDRHPAIDRVLVALLVGEVRALDKRLLEAFYVPAEQRVLRRLVDLSRSFIPSSDGTIELPLTQEDLATFAGTSRATVNAVLREEESAGRSRSAAARRAFSTSPLCKRARGNGERAARAAPFLLFASGAGALRRAYITAQILHASPAGRTARVGPAERVWDVLREAALRPRREVGLVAVEDATGALDEERTPLGPAAEHATKQRQMVTTGNARNLREPRSASRDRRQSASHERLHRHTQGARRRRRRAAADQTTTRSHGAYTP